MVWRHKLTVAMRAGELGSIVFVPVCALPDINIAPVNTL